MAPRRTTHRRGVVLLLVLSLLVLFGLLALTFLIGATRFRRGAEAFSQHDLRGDPPMRLFDKAVHQLVRDADNPSSSIRGHSLLFDLYGGDGTGGRILQAFTSSSSPIPPVAPTTNDVATGEILRFDVESTRFETGTFGEPSSHDDYYAGSVLTLLNGPGAPQSARIVRYIVPNPARDPNRRYYSFYVEGFDHDATTIRDFINRNRNTVRFLVNGKPFNGPGLGYSLQHGGRADLDSDYVNPNSPHFIPPRPAAPFYYGVPIAIQPHYAQYFSLTPAASRPRGDADESYDALDHQNMFLARNPPDPSTLPIVASFHRGALVAYASAAYASNWGSSVGYRSFRRRFIFRPMPWDHPDFTGGNPTLVAARTPTGFAAWNTTVGDGQPGFAMVDDDGDGGVDNLNLDTDGDGVNDYSTEAGWPGSDDLLMNDGALVSALIAAGTTSGGLYDVDNDGDGVNDSFWLDLQFPVQTSKDGRLYKPLFAFLVTDMDGRLNVNVHGSIAQTQRDYHTGRTGLRPYAGRNGALVFLEDLSNLDGDPNPDRPAHGQGYGPAEISLRGLLDAPNNHADVNDYQLLLLARYRADGAPGSAYPQPAPPNPPVPPFPVPASPSEDFLTFLKSVGRPHEYANANGGYYGSWNAPSAFMTAPDLHGWGAVGLNNAGQPVWRYSGRQGTFQLQDRNGNTVNVVASERVNHPYEFNVVRPDGDDDPFTPAELERVLRWRDADAGVLANRLFNLFSDASDGSPTIDQISKLITTHSAYIGSPPTVPLPPDDGVTNAQIFDILFPTDLVLNSNPPRRNPLQDNAARIATRVVNPNNTAQVIGMDGAARMPALFDLMAAKIVQGHLVQANNPLPSFTPNNQNGIPGVVADPSGNGLRYLQNQLDYMLAFEFRHGQKMDPNRLWGNGVDDTGNAVVDEQFWNPTASPPKPAWETQLLEAIWANSSAAGTVPDDYLNDDPLRSTRTPEFYPRGREMYARHLYCLMMLLVDLEYVPGPPSAAGAPQAPGFMEPYIDPSITNDVQRRELTVRRIAQWAINAVDFRDADAIMTPFEYDVNPWNGYDVDGDPSTDDLGNPSDWRNDPGNPSLVEPERRLIWGCEHPDLLITETFAFHDRRVKDTAEDDGDGRRRNESMNADEELDQYRLPQGSLFVELYCPPRNFFNNGGDVDLKVAPRELYNVSAATGVQLDLERVAPPPTVQYAGPRYPVWRLAISESYSRGARAGVLKGPLELIVAGQRDNVSFQPSSPDQPDEMYLVPPASGAPDVPPLPIERVVWFAKRSPAAAPAFPPWEQDRVYYRRYGATALPAGEYLVVGPRAVTRVGAQDEGGDPTAGTIDQPSNQVFRLVEDNSFTARFSYGDFGYPLRLNVDAPRAQAQVKVARTMIVGADPPPNWGAFPLRETANLLAGVLPSAGAPAPEEGVGLSVSEPLRHEYYPEPTEYLDGAMPTPDYPLRDSWRDVTGQGGQPGTFPDIPYDTDPDRAGYLPVRDDVLSETGRYDDYKTVFLQRLANPLLPWDRFLNPYITVDWQPIDLTVFNGEDKRPDNYMGPEPYDPDDDPDQNGSPNLSADRPFNDPPFAARERIGQRTVPLTINTGLWNPASVPFDQAEGLARSVDYFKLNARHSLGYLSRQVDNDPEHPNPPAMMASDVNDFVGSAQHDSAVGDPRLPFEWFLWNNRPYVSHLELMFVPASSPGRMLFEYIHRTPSGPDPYLAYDLATPPTMPADPEYVNHRAPFGHLLNFFNTTKKLPSGATERGANFYRLLDFVEVPSRFAGAEKWYNPAQIRNAPSVAADVVRYRPPFNNLSRFRDPGRVNLNTVWDLHIWQGVSDGFPLMANLAFWDAIQDTIKANAPNAPDEYPTAYPNPFRAAGSALLGPTLPPGVTDMDPLRMQQDPVEATLLRSEDMSPASGPRQPLFDNPNFSDSTVASDNLAFHPQPNPYFRYQGLQRLGNLVSSQSNVYAVWVTVGFFEVERSPAGQDREHPDGYLLGQEVGAETGEVVRHRAFYLIDRSIPAAFEPGVNHNVEKTILLRRFIE